MTEEIRFDVSRVMISNQHWMYQPRGNMVEIRMKTQEDSKSFEKELNELFEKYSIKMAKARAHTRQNDIGESSFEDYQANAG